MTFNQFIRALPLLLLLALCIGLSMGLFSAPPENDTRLIGQKIQTIDLPQLSDPSLHFTSRNWYGKVAILNVFASWCEPCKLEHALLLQLADTKKAPIYGIAWRDTPEHVASWLNKAGNPYQAIGVDTQGFATIPLSLSGVPETFVIAADGTVRYHHHAPLTADEINDTLLPLVDSLSTPAPPPATR